MDGNAKPPSSPAVSARFQEALARLRQEFEQQLPAKMERARALMQACVAGPHDQDAIVELHRLLHTLAGSAGTFGRAPLGNKAKDIELMLDDLLDKEGRSSDDFEAPRRELAQLLALAAA